MRVLQINLNNRNFHHTAVIDYINATKPDLLLLSEVTPIWGSALDKGLGNFRKVAVIARVDTYGIAVYTTSIDNISTVINYFGSTGHPSITSNFMYAGQPIALVFTHLQGPIKEHWFKLHSEEIPDLSQKLAKIRVPLILCGDMNCTPWTYLLSDLQANCRLRDSSAGFGPQLSWPTFMSFRNVPTTPLLPIDHCFISKEFSVLNRSIGPNVGSDHLPVLVELGISDVRIERSVLEYAK
ncbi:MAG: endonuclease/exonuclease/phosphatase family protein [Candidatus Obscuribacterales bacterium]|nr:endonuclease/exonuclease/phosphatase family protein [Candidatus Obscuribacterales bacterium]